MKVGSSKYSGNGSLHCSSSLFIVIQSIITRVSRTPRDSEDSGLVWATKVMRTCNIRSEKLVYFQNSLKIPAAFYGKGTAAGQGNDIGLSCYWTCPRTTQAAILILTSLAWNDAAAAITMHALEQIRDGDTKTW